ncbi:MAG: CDP-diacylglycerol--glycerol-3-phosphate 3-phosphatidyltransferase [Eubacterium sp.]|nr:CDP-diacylglycerol--glycerol-3-phosphate 3-phosphatidyltransferase [Eubacterium sp.]
MNLPNKITIFRFVCIPVLFLTALVQIKYHWTATFIVYLIGCISDKLDGTIARKHNLITDFGKLFDPLADKAFMLAAFLILINLGWHTELVIMLMMVREFLVAGVRMAASVEGETIPANIFGKLKTLLQMITAGVAFFILALLERNGETVITASGFNPPAYLFNYCTVAFWLTGVVTFISGLKYLKDGWHLIKTK